MRRIPTRTTLSVAALLCVFFLQTLLSMGFKSSTSDEGVHLAAGYGYLAHRRFDLNPEHPPLMKLLAALPLLTLEPPLAEDDPAWDLSGRGQFLLGVFFLYGHDWEGRADLLLRLGRIPIVIVGALGCLIVFLWARRLFGVHAGLASLCFMVFLPEVVGHSRVVTTDMGLCTFLFLSLYLLSRYLERPTRLGLALVCAALAAALAAKFSGILAFPIALFMWALQPASKAFAGPGGWYDPFSPSRRAPVLAKSALLFLLTAMLAILVVWSCYFFEEGPWLYFRNMSKVNSNHDPGYPYYLLGEFRTGRFWTYFPVAFLVKTPVGFLAAIALGTPSFLSRLRRDRRLGLFVVAPLVILAAASLLADNIGVRYVLPAVPFLAVIAGSAAASANPKWMRCLAVVLLAAGAGEGLAVFPDHLSFFNLAAGGPARGPFILDDSNIDWGQDLKRVDAYVRKHDLNDAELLYYWRRTNPPPYYVHGCRIRPDDDPLVRIPQTGTYIVSVQSLIRLKDPRSPLKDLPDWLAEVPRSGRIGWSLWVFNLDAEARAHAQE